jgi:hypothetical protein
MQSFEIGFSNLPEYYAGVLFDIHDNVIINRTVTSVCRKEIERGKEKEMTKSKEKKD